MATTKTTGKRATSRNGSRAKSSTSRKNSGPKRSNSSRSSANGRQTKAASSGRSRSRASSQDKSAIAAAKDTAVDRSKGAGHAIADAASKVKTPLIAGGTALLGVAAGAAIKDRVGRKSKNPIKRMRGSSMPKLDLDTVKTTADRVSTYGQQASDIAAAVEKTRKKNG